MPGSRRSRSAGVLVCLALAGCGADERAGSAPAAAAAAAVDWRSTTYELTCDGIVPGGFRAQVVDGRASVPADGTRPPYYDHYEVRVVDTAAGDLDADGGAETVVLLTCSPQPSNGVLQEVLVLASPGRLLGSLPSPRTLQGQALLPPVHERISVQDGVIVADMSAYAATDSHASGPSEPFTVRFSLGPAGVAVVSPS